MANTVTFTGNSFLNPYGMPTRNKKQSQQTNVTTEQLSNALAIAHLTTTPDEEIDPGGVDDNPDAHLTSLRPTQTELATVTSTAITPIEEIEPATRTITSPPSTITPQLPSRPPTPQLEDIRKTVEQQQELLQKQNENITTLLQENARLTEESKKRTHDKVDQPPSGFGNVRLPNPAINKLCVEYGCGLKRMQRPGETRCSKCKNRLDLDELRDLVGYKDEVNEIKALKKQKIVMDNMVKLAWDKNALKSEIAKQKAAVDEILSTNQ